MRVLCALLCLLGLVAARTPKLQDDVLSADEPGKLEKILHHFIGDFGGPPAKPERIGFEKSGESYTVLYEGGSGKLDGRTVSVEEELDHTEKLVVEWKDTKKETFYLPTDVVLVRVDATPPVAFVHDRNLVCSFPDNENNACVHEWVMHAQELVEIYTLWQGFAVGSAPIPHLGVRTPTEVRAIMKPAFDALARRMREQGEYFKQNWSDVLQAKKPTIVTMNAMAHGLSESLANFHKWADVMKRVNVSSSHTGGPGWISDAHMQSVLDNLCKDLKQEAFGNTGTPKVELSPLGAKALKAGSDKASSELVKLIQKQIQKERDLIPKGDPFAHKFELERLDEASQLAGKMGKELSGQLYYLLANAPFMKTVDKFVSTKEKQLKDWGKNVGSWFKDLFKSDHKSKEIHDVVAAPLSPSEKAAADAMYAAGRAHAHTELMARAVALDNQTKPEKFKSKYDISIKPQFQLAKEFLKNIEVNQKFKWSKSKVQHILDFNMRVDDPFVKDKSKLTAELKWDAKQSTTLGEFHYGAKIKTVVDAVFHKPNLKTIAVDFFAEYKHGIVSTGFYGSVLVPFEKGADGKSRVVPVSKLTTKGTLQFAEHTSLTWLGNVEFSSINLRAYDLQVNFMHGFGDGYSFGTVVKSAWKAETKSNDEELMLRFAYRKKRMSWYLEGGVKFTQMPLPGDPNFAPQINAGFEITW